MKVMSKLSRNSLLTIAQRHPLMGLEGQIKIKFLELCNALLNNKNHRGR